MRDPGSWSGPPSGWVGARRASPLRSGWRGGRGRRGHSVRRPCPSPPVLPAGPSSRLARTGTRLRLWDPPEAPTSSWDSRRQVSAGTAKAPRGSSGQKNTTMTGMQGLGAVAGPLGSCQTPFGGQSPPPATGLPQGLAGRTSAWPTDPACPGRSPSRCSGPRWAAWVRACPAGGGVGTRWGGGRPSAPATSSAS